MNEVTSGVSRREFIQVAAGIVVCGFCVPGLGAIETEKGSMLAPNAFIRIDTLGAITLVIPQVEMGQGTYTSLSMILAEELDADWDRVRVEHAPADEKLYVNPMLSIQATGNSNSVRAFWEPLRMAGATTRAMLVEAAARMWNVSATECVTRDSRVIHSRSNRAIDYGALVGKVEAATSPVMVRLKDPSEFRLIGRPLKRLDTKEKSDGLARFGIDALPEGVRFATLVLSPVLGGTVAHVDDSATRSVPGVRQVVVLNDLVAVIGDHYWAAKQGLEKLRIEWNEGPNADVSSEVIWSRLRDASRRDGAIARDTGHVEDVFGMEGSDLSDVVSLEYELPLLAHACMEPLNCTVHVMELSAEAWIGTQVMQRVHAAVAKATGLPERQVTIHNHLLGGGFGRRLEPDMAYDAARIAKHVKGPVKVVWSREADVRHDVYRPAYHNSLSARMRQGRIVGWRHKISGSSVMARFLPAFFQNGVDPDGVDSARDVPYDIPNVRVAFNREEPPGVNTGFWRGVGPNNNVFAIESFMDELARMAGADPINFRQEHLGKVPRLQAALELVRKKSQWGTPLPERCGRGVSVQTSFGSFIATVVECAVDDNGEIRLRRVTTAVDTGVAINPDTIAAQLQGGHIFGLTAALYGEVHLKKGRVLESNFHDYRMLRINEVPDINIHLVGSGESPGGIGEAGTTAAVPALRNAIFAATGIPLRRMPIDRELLAK